ncbi:MAG: hypothetical protein V1672_04635 [Candidatus Diapherotrites archaeon]
MKKIIFILVLFLIFSGCVEQPVENNEIINEPVGNEGPENTVTDNFLELFSQTPNFKAVYVMTNNGVKGDGGQIAIYYKDGKIRKDILAGDVLQHTWILKDKIVVCVKPGILPEACEEQTIEDAEESDLELYALKVNTDLIKETPEKYTITKLGLRKYSTEFGECYKLEHTIDDEKFTSEYCATEDGIILYIKTLSENTEGFLLSEIEAVEVLREVTDANLEPPVIKNTGTNDTNSN